MLKSVLKYCCLALAACVGSFAFASDVMQQTRVIAAYVAQTETFGAASAQFKNELNFMADTGDTRMCSRSGALVKDSHGFLQASASEVTKGTTGSTVSLSLS